MPTNNYSMAMPGSSFLMDFMRGNQQAGMQRQMPFSNMPGPTQLGIGLIGSGGAPTPLAQQQRPSGVVMQDGGIRGSSGAPATMQAGTPRLIGGALPTHGTTPNYGGQQPAWRGRPTTYMPLGGGALPSSSGPTTYQTGIPRVMGGALPTSQQGGPFNYGQQPPAYRPTGVPQMGYGLRNPFFNMPQAR